MTTATVAAFSSIGIVMAVTIAYNYCNESSFTQNILIVDDCFDCTAIGATLSRESSLTHSELVVMTVLQ